MWSKRIKLKNEKIALKNWNNRRRSKGTREVKEKKRKDCQKKIDMNIEEDVKKEQEKQRKKCGTS